MALNELICGFLITTELIFSIQIIEKCSQTTGNSLKCAKPKSLFYAGQLYHSEHVLCYMYRSLCKLKHKPYVMNGVEVVGQKTLTDNLSRNLKFIKIFKIHKLLELLRNILSGAWSKFEVRSACNNRLHWRPQGVSSKQSYCVIVWLNGRKLLGVDCTVMGIFERAGVEKEGYI